MSDDVRVNGKLTLPADTAPLEAAIRAHLRERAPEGEAPLTELVQLLLWPVHVVDVRPWTQVGTTTPAADPDGRTSYSLESEWGGYDHHEEDVVWGLLAAAGAEADIEFEDEYDGRWRILLGHGRHTGLRVSPDRLWPGSPLERDLVEGITREEARAILALAAGDTHPAAAALVAKAAAALG